MNYSILQNFKKSKLILEPFPHIIIENCLDDKLYRQLEKSFPIHLINKNQDNIRGDIYSYQLEHHDQNLWKNFLNYHCSSVFLIEVLKAFENYFNEEKKLYNKITDLISKKIKVFPEVENNLISMSASISYNTPVIKPSSIRGPHRDKPNKLYGALLYFRGDEDKTEGGDLELYDNGSVFKKINYNKNTLVLFINNQRSYHGVTKRFSSNDIRKFCYFSTICPFNLYSNEKKFFQRFRDIILSIFR